MKVVTNEMNKVNATNAESFINKFTGSVLIIGVNESNLPGSLIINFPADLESSVVARAKEQDDLESVVNIKYRGVEDLPSTVQPALSSDLHSSVSVRPHNRMSGIVEVVEPPVIVAEFSPIEDTYVREDMPKLNYGRDGDQFVGTNWNGTRYRTLLRFDISDLPADKRIKKATLVLELLNSRPSIPIGVYEIPVGQEWTEYGVTWDSQPSYGTLIKSYDSGVYAGRTEVDLTSYVTELYEGKREHNGLMLKSLIENTLGSYKQYGTRETEDENLRPKLIVEYYDPTVFSYKRDDLRWSVFVIANNKSELDSSVVVAGYVEEDDLPGSITVRDPMAPVSDDLPSVIGVTRDELPSYVWVLGSDHVDSSVIVRNTSVLELESTVGVSRGEVPSEVYVRYYEDLESYVYAKARENNDLDSYVIVNVKEREGSVYVRFYDDLDSTVEPRVADDKDLDGVVGVTRDELPSQVHVRWYDDLESYIQPRAYLNSDLDSSVWVRSEFFAGSVIVRVEDYSEMPFTVTARETDSEDLDSRILPRVPFDHDLEGTVEVRLTDQDDVPGTVIPRVVGASDLSTTVEVDIAYNLPSRVFIRGTGIDDLDSVIGVRHDDLIDLHSRLITRIEEYGDLDGSVTSRVRAEEDLDGEVFVREVLKHELPGSVRPRVTGHSDLHSVVEVGGEIGYVFIM